MKLVFVLVMFLAATSIAADGSVSTKGLASWYGEAHRGKIMADGRKFDPDKLTAASWFYPLGSRVRVTSANSRRNIIVRITDRGPAKRLVREGRIIDLARAAFEKLAPPNTGLVSVTVRPVND